MTIQTARFHKLREHHDRRNFRLGVTNGVLYGLGTYFVGSYIFDSADSRFVRIFVNG